MSFLDDAAARLVALPTVRVLYADLDGTLLGPGGSLLHDVHGRPSARAATALAEAAAAGLLVVPVSGRHRALVVENARLLGLGDAIGEAGGVLHRGGEVTYAWGQCPRGLADTPRGALEAAGVVTTLLEAFAGDLRPYEPWDAGREAGFLLHGDVDVGRANAVLRRAGLGWAELADNGPADGWPGRAVRTYQLRPHGVGKSVAVAEDLSARGLSPQAAAAIGDSPEDASMASAVGVYFVVANGTGRPPDPALVTPGAMGEGVAQAIEALLAVAEVRAESGT
ncbi:HAD family phosphatase [Egibacter rhizosphaerae]|uniref:HAD family phosphatase n=1 Tax=Egibacter rhizosphaerae TaxID=1670831 RepID=A0A411YIL3_9ACTN|nr:HAD family phosphatase [Egibacter rhizosphaerae]QBI20991.1 HAD family phosphatase [Egibacter rhizosphaerae]